MEIKGSYRRCSGLLCGRWTSVVHALAFSSSRGSSMISRASGPYRLTSTGALLGRSFERLATFRQRQSRLLASISRTRQFQCLPSTVSARPFE